MLESCFTTIVSFFQTDNICDTGYVQTYNALGECEDSYYNEDSQKLKRLERQVIITTEKLKQTQTMIISKINYYKSMCDENLKQAQKSYELSMQSKIYTDVCTYKLIALHKFKFYKLIASKIIFLQNMSAHFDQMRLEIDNTFFCITILSDLKSGQTILSKVSQSLNSINITSLFDEIREIMDDQSSREELIITSSLSDFLDNENIERELYALKNLIGEETEKIGKETKGQQQQQQQQQQQRRRRQQKEEEEEEEEEEKVKVKIYNKKGQKENVQILSI